GGERNARAVLLAERKQTIAVPGRDEPERVLAGALEPDALDVRVEVPRVDELRAALIRRFGDGAHERGRPRLGLDVDDLPGLDVGADLDDQRGVATQRLGIHGGGG